MRKRRAPWQKDTDPSGSGQSRAKLAAVTIACLATVVGIVWLISLLTRPYRPGLLVLAGEPKAGGKAVPATRFDVPYDPHGWLSGQRLLDTANQIAKFPDEKLYPTPLGERPFALNDCEGWKQKLREDSHVDPVLIYVGLHGGVNGTGQAILYTGNAESFSERESDARHAMRVSKFLEYVQEAIPRKRKIIIFDTGRGPPDPYLGELYTDFTRAVVKELSETIAKDPTLAVILGCSDGQQAWDSPDLGVTPLAHYLLRALEGDACPDSRSSFHAKQLFEYVHEQVVLWSRNNRPTTQKPILLPDLDKWTDREREKAFERRVLFRPNDPIKVRERREEIVKSLPIQGTEKLTTAWRRCEELSKRIPSPATYTPAAWRRYRELMLRYELAIEVNDAVSIDAIETAMRQCVEVIERGLNLPPNALPYSLALQKAVGSTTTVYDPREMVKAVSLVNAVQEGKRNLGNATRLPQEVHLPVMLAHFEKDVYPQGGARFMDHWKDLVRQRIQSERAAVALHDAAPAWPMSERVWPFLESRILRADANRRQVEDGRFHASKPEDSAKLTRLLAEAKIDYDTAEKLASQIQPGFVLRDELLADLPFLSRWVAELDVDAKQPDEHDTLRKMLTDIWGATHNLCNTLESLTPESFAQRAEPPTLVELRDIVFNLQPKYDELRKAVTNTTSRTRGDRSQNTWQWFQTARHLAVPLVSAEQRTIWRENLRSIGKDLSEKKAELEGRMDGRKVHRRHELAAVSLPSAWKGWRETQNDLPGLEAANVGAIEAPPLDQSALQSDRWFQRLRRLAVFGGEANAVPAPWKEAFSRLALVDGDVSEPAVVNAQKRWRELFEAFALRAALDHWYDETGQPYSTKRVAQAYLEAAKELTARLNDPNVDENETVKRAKQLMATPPLGLRVNDGTANAPIRWTSEAELLFKYQLTQVPYAVPGDATIWWTSANGNLLEVPEPLQQIPLAQSWTKDVKIRAGKDVREKPLLKQLADVRADAYFRGQWRGQLQHTLTARINNQPNLVRTERPPIRYGLLAVRADKDFNPGLVNMVIDYSSSMRNEWKESPGEKKFIVVRKIFEDLLRKHLASKAELRARLMIENLQNSTITSKLLGDTSNPLARDPLIRTLDGQEPSGVTPLLKTIKESLADFPTDRSDLPRSLIILTDGADTSLQEKLFAADRFLDKATGQRNLLEADQMTEAERRKLVEEFHKLLVEIKDTTVSLNLVIFGTTRVEEDLAVEMFQPIERFKTPGRIFIARDRAQLAQELQQALRPKPRLLDNDGQAIGQNPDLQYPARVPVSGMPTNLATDSEGSLWWRGYLQAGEYQLKYHKSEQRLEFRAGDVMTVKMHQEDDRVRFERELYYKDVENFIKNGQRPERQDDTDPNWLLSLPVFGHIQHETNYLVATTSMESKRGTSVPGGLLTQLRPSLMWWELTRVGEAGAEERVPMPLYWRTLDRQPVPSYRLVSVHDNKLDSLKQSRFKISGWPLSMENDYTMDLTPSQLQTATTLTKTFEGGQVTISARLEETNFLPNLAADRDRIEQRYQGKPQRCFVFRVTDTKGRLFHFRHTNTKTESTNDLTIEHRYYYDPDDASLRPRVIGYTAVVGPVNDKVLSDNIALQIGLVNISERLEQVKKLAVGPLQPGPVNNEPTPLSASEDVGSR